MLQRAASGGKALKSALVLLASDRPRTHQISVLLAELSAVRPDAVEALGDLAALDPYYVTTRYPDAIGGAVPGMSFFEPEARLALDRAARAVTYVEGILGE